MINILFACNSPSGDTSRQITDQDSLIYPEDYRLDKYDYIPDVPAEVMETRLKEIEKEVPLHFNLIVRDFINYFAVRDRDYTRLMLARGRKYFPMIEAYLKKHNLPDELKYMAIVESGLNPKATSPAGAVGLWQFMRPVARQYNLKVNQYVDHRMDPERSTEAACRLLGWLHDAFDDWELALAAYNTGYGNVKKAVRISGKNNFWGAYRYLFRETRSYVPQFVAITYIFHYAEEHNLFPEFYEANMETRTIPVHGYLDLEKFSQELNLCLDDVLELNPQIVSSRLPKHTRDFALNIPADKYFYVLANYHEVLEQSDNEFLPDPYNHKQVPQITHQVQAHENLQYLSLLYNVSVRNIREWNNLYLTKLNIGQQLTLFPDNETSTGLNNVTSHTTYVVQPGDSLWSIALKYDDLTISQIRQMNDLDDFTLQPGQKLKILP
ncbi:MAG: transglycosylase SLT domain-containing protein [Candidatus Cyclobacteriaceae bacterium M3_2C_046]